MFLPSVSLKTHRGSCDIGIESHAKFGSTYESVKAFLTQGKVSNGRGSFQTAKSVLFSETNGFLTSLSRN